MPFAVVQSTLEPPTLDQLRQAFTETARAGLNVTAVDAGAIQRDSFGILLRRLSEAHARVACGALAAVGYEAHAVDEAQLLGLPQLKSRIVIDPADDALRMADVLNRVEVVPYDQVVLVGAGMVGSPRFLRSRERVTGLMDPYAWPVYTLDVTEATHFAPRLEMLFACEPWRVQAEGRRMSYRCLGERKTHRAEVNFMLLVRRLAERTGRQVLTRGAAAVASLDDTVAVYPTNNAFEEELIWHAWHAMR